MRLTEPGGASMVPSAARILPSEATMLPSGAIMVPGSADRGCAWLLNNEVVGLLLDTGMLADSDTMIPEVVEATAGWRMAPSGNIRGVPSSVVRMLPSAGLIRWPDVLAMMPSGSDRTLPSAVV